MNIENYIESQYRELLSCSQINAEYSDLYKSFRNQKLREILMTLHHDLVGLFRTMNERLPTGEHEAHFWAEPSRDLIKRIEIIFSLVSSLKETPLAFQIDPYYLDLLTRCRDFLSSSGGSALPPNMAKVELYYTLPIFLPLSSITISHKQQDFTFDLKLIGSGSYANVYKYKDSFYNRPFILKRAKKELTDKEVARFKREFDVMNDLSSPYILEVYYYNPDKNEYIMEYMDYTLDGYIAEVTGLSTPHISNIETGNTKLGLPTIIHLANVLDVSVDELLCDNIHRSEKIFQNELAELLQGCDAHELHLITELAKVVKKNSLDGVKKTRGRKPKNKI